MRGRLVVGGFALVAVLALVGALIARPFEVRLTEADVQRQLDAHLPVRATHVGQTFAIETARVHFRPDGRVGIEATLAVDVGLANVHRTGSVVASARVELRGDAFYLASPLMERVQLDGHEQSGYGLAARAVAQLLARQLQDRPVYRLDPRRVARAGPLLALREVRVESGVLIAVLDAGTLWRRFWARMG
jgi:hypothetical protein